MVAFECQYHGWEVTDGAGCNFKGGALAGEKRLCSETIAYGAVFRTVGAGWIYSGFFLGAAGAAKPHLTVFAKYGEKGWTTFSNEDALRSFRGSMSREFLDLSTHGGFVHKGLVSAVTTTRGKTHCRRAGEGRLRGKPYSGANRSAKSVVSPLVSFPKGRELKTHRPIRNAEYQPGGPTTLGRNRHFIITSQCTPIAEFRDRGFYTVNGPSASASSARWCAFPLFEPLYHATSSFGRDVGRFACAGRGKISAGLEGPRFLTCGKPICWG